MSETEKIYYAVCQAIVQEINPETGAIVADFSTAQTGQVDSVDQIPKVPSAVGSVDCRRIVTYGPASGDTFNAIVRSGFRRLRSFILAVEQGKVKDPWFVGYDESYTFNTIDEFGKPKVIAYTPRLVNPHAAAAFAAGA